MIHYKTTILKFGEQGEKTGWTYIEIPADVAQQIKPGNKKPFRIKGKLDGHPFAGIAAMPMGDGNFILPLKAAIRKMIGKKHGAMLVVELEEDTSPMLLDEDLMDCLNDEPKALEFFNTLAKGHQRYYSNWIESAKTEATKTKRIAQAINALHRKQHYGEMIRWLKENR